MKIILNPKYAHLRAYLMEIDRHFEKEGREIHRGRNVIRTLHAAGLALCVKRYAAAPLASRLACKLYGTPKGQRAYLRPLLLRERGFESPEPVAFVKFSRGWFNSESYFVCLQSDYRYCMADVMTLPADERRDVTACFARYAARLHQDGFLHRDFSAGNILFDRVRDRWRFALVDTNSMRCGRPVGVARGCANFARLEGDDGFFRQLAEVYAAERGADAARCLELIDAARRRYRAHAAPPAADASRAHAI